MLISIPVDSELLNEVRRVLEPMGLTPEAAFVQFLEYCANPLTQDDAIKLLKKWAETDKET